MQTRAAARLAAQAVSQPQVTKTEPVKAGTKRAATSQPTETRQAKRRGAKAKQPSQPAKGALDVLPHGLGTVHHRNSSQATSSVQGVNNNLQKHTATPNDDDQLKSSDYQKDNDSQKGTAKEKSTADGKDKKGTANPYGLMPGRTPFPNHQGPTAEQCQTVHDILTAQHGERKSPSKILPPSTEVAGCGEVPDILDAMMRTMVSANTKMTNADRVIKEIIKVYGVLDKDGLGAGSVDWNAVRLSPIKKLQKAMFTGGLSKTKSEQMKKILDQVFEENQLRKAAFIKEKESGEAASVKGATRMSRGQKDHQLLKIDNGILTLDHIRTMPAAEAMPEILQYKGIGVKTASCLLLFCLQQPSFAVDTHVWRFCLWLGWVPKGTEVNKTFKHCDYRVPDELKYGLHQLFIAHGQQCYRCRSGTAKGTAQWNAVVCPLEHLLDRFEKHEAKPAQKSKKASLKEEKTENEEPSEDTVEEDMEQAPMRDVGAEDETQSRSSEDGSDGNAI
ncbi:HhH-GPD family base excision DNA repair protein [Colletotrichum camelliae]|nr:HhH-GPD family base excision DNA repair protein [Colletotrichum camelliae]